MTREPQFCEPTKSVWTAKHGSSERDERDCPLFLGADGPTWSARRGGARQVVGITDWALIGYTLQVIVRFRHKGLQLLFEKGDRQRVAPAYVAKVERILARLDEVTAPTGMDLPGFRLHPLKGDLAGYWAVTVSGNWRIVFRFAGADATDVDLVDYH